MNNTAIWYGRFFFHFFFLIHSSKIRLILQFHSSKMTLNRPKTSKMFGLENVMQTYTVKYCACNACAQMHTQEVQCIFLFLRHSSFFCMTASPGTPTENPSMCARVCVRSWRLENTVTPKGSHLFPFLPSSLIPSWVCACRDFLFQFRRDVRPVPPSLTQRLDSAIHSPNICKNLHITHFFRSHCQDETQEGLEIITSSTHLKT